ncbi:MAG: TonB-dependent receptor [Lewinellaceae bacterium]|nr:TonB-dependent receptor [Lewinellaceae bacterium]
MRLIICLLSLGLTSLLTAQNGIIRGKVTDRLTNEPVAFANVVIPSLNTGATTDENGQYEISNLQPGLYDLTVSFVGFLDGKAFEIQVSNARPAQVDFALEQVAEQLGEVVIQASPFKKTEESPVSLRTIGVAEIQRNPGGNRDISRVVQSLPGVTTTASFRNDLIIRGGGPNENRFFLDEVEVPNINHFATQGASGGPVGLINVNFINEVDFFSGAFPANRGNALSSVFNFRQRDGRDDRLGGTFMVGATDIGLMLEGPIGDKTTFLFSARRSYLQFLFKAIGLPFLPTYNDFQAKVKIKLDERNELTFIGLGAIDQFELNLEANEDEEKQFLLDQLPTTPQWNYTNGLVWKHYGDRGYWTFVLSRNMLNNEAYKYANNDESNPQNLLLDYQSQEIENKLRVERTLRTGAGFKINYGVAYELASYNNRTFNRIFTSSGAQTIDYRSDLSFQKYGAFGQLSHTFADERLVLSLGARVDGNSYSGEMNNPLRQFSPRFSLAYSFNEKLALNFNTGIFYQLPPYTIMGYQEDGRLVNRDNGIRYVGNTQLVAGLEWNTNFSSKITLEGFYKNYRHYPFLLRDSVTLANLGGDFGVVGNEPAVPQSTGRTYGLEFLFQQRLFKGFYGILAYTLGWSEFADKNGELIPSSWDARHIVSLTAGKKLPRNWEIGINWRFQSGLPGTPFAPESALVANWMVNNRGIRNFNQLNTLRNDASNTLDFRVDKKWFFPKWNLNLYFDIENVFGNAVGNDELVLDRTLDETGKPVGPAVIVNPDAPANQQRYLLKTISDAQGTALPSIGIMIEW